MAGNTNSPAPTPTPNNGVADRSLDPQSITPEMHQSGRFGPGADFNLPSPKPSYGGGTARVSQQQDLMSSLKGLADNIQKGSGPHLKDAAYVSREFLPRGYEKYPGYRSGYSQEENENIAAHNQGFGERTANVLKNGTVRFGKTLLESTVGTVAGIGYMMGGTKDQGFFNNPVVAQLEEWGKQLESPIYETKERKNASLLSPTYWASANALNSAVGMVGDIAALYLTGKILAAPFNALGKLAGLTVEAATGGERAFAETLGQVERMSLPEYNTAIDNLAKVVAGMPENEIKVQGKELLNSLNEIQKAGLTSEQKWAQSTKLISEASKKYATNLKYITKVQQGLISTISNLGMAQSSGYESYVGVKQKMIQDIYNEGRKPTDEELKTIDKVAQGVGGWTAGLMTMMGAFTLHGIAKGIFAKGEAEELLSLQMNEIKEGAEKTVTIDGVETKVRQYADERFVPKAGSSKASQLAQRAWHITKGAPGWIQSHADLWPGIGMMEFSLAPKTIEDFYMKKYKRANGSLNTNPDDDIIDDMQYLSESLGKNVKGMFTKEGLSDFFLGVIGALPFEARAKFENRKELDKNTNDFLKAVNSTYLQSHLRANMDAGTRGLVLRDEYLDALRTGDMERANTLRQQQVENWMYPYIKYGKKKFAIEEIENMKNRANTDEGLRELQGEKIIPEGDDLLKLRKNYQEYMDGLKKYIEDADAYYKAVKLKYNGYLKDEHFQKLVALSGGIDDASRRVKKLGDEISQTPIGTDPEFMKAYKDLIDYYGRQAGEAYGEGTERKKAGLYARENVLEEIELAERNGKFTPDPKQYAELSLLYEGAEPGVIERDGKRIPAYRPGRVVDEITKGILKRIDTMRGDLNPDQKMDLARKVIDTFKLQVLKKRYMAEYEDIIRNPKDHEDKTVSGISAPNAKPSDEDQIEPSDVVLKVGSKEGEKRFKRGNVYHSNEVITPGKGSKAGKAKWKDFQSFYIPEDNDPIMNGMPVISDEEGNAWEKGKKFIFVVDTKTKQGTYVPESAFEKGKFMSDADLSKKENANMKFFIDNTDTPFRMKYWRREDGKNVYDWVEGKLTKFDPEEPDEFLFTPNDKKNYRPRNVSKDDFKRKGNFGANIESLDPLSKVSEDWIKGAVTERDKEAAQRIAERNINTLIEHIDEREKTLKKLRDDIEDNKVNIEIHKEELEAVQKQIEKTKKDPLLQKPWAERNKEEREYYRKHFKSVVDAGKNLTKTIKGLEDTNVSLQNQADEIEREVSWLDNLDPTTFPEGKVEILNFIDDNRANLMIAQEETKKGIGAIKDLIKSAKQALDGIVNNVLGRMEMFSKKYLGGLPFGSNAMELFLKREVDDRRELGSMSEGNLSDILPEVTREFEDIQKAVVQAEEFDIPMRETEIDKNVKDLADLEQKMKSLNEELAFQTNLFDAFKKAWDQYEKEDLKRQEFTSDEYVNKLVKLQGAMDMESADDEPGNPEQKKKQGKQYWKEAAIPLLGRQSEDKSTLPSDEAADRIGAEGDQDAAVGKWVKRYNTYIKNRNNGFPVPENKEPGARYLGELSEPEERIVVITYNNQDKYFKFDKKNDKENFISRSYEYEGKVVDNTKDAENGTIRYVHVARGGDDPDFYFIDENGKLLAKVNEAKDINLKDLIFSNRATYNPYEFRIGKDGEPLTDRSGRKIRRYIKPEGMTDSDAKAIHAVSKNLRKELFENPEASRFYSFDEARGTVREQREPSVGGKRGKVKVTSRSVGKAALVVDRPDPNVTLKGTLQVPTLRQPGTNAGVVEVGGYAMRFPIGQGVIVNRNNAMIVDNNRFEPSQVDHLYKVITAMAEDYLEKGEINPVYKKYLSRVLHFSGRIGKEGISKNQLYFDKKGNLAFAREKLQEVKNSKGETDVEIVSDDPLLITFLPSDVKFYEKEIKEWLGEAFHSISSAGLRENGFTEITDIKYEDGKPVPVTREWTSYEDYLMSDYIRLKDDAAEGKKPELRPDGKRPLTVNVNNAEEWQGPFANKYIVPRFTEAEYPEIKVFTKKKAAAKTKTEGDSEPEAVVPTLGRKDNAVVSVTKTGKDGKEKTYHLDGRENVTDNLIPLIFKATLKDGDISVEMLGIDEEKFQENLDGIKDQQKKDKLIADKEKVDLDKFEQSYEKTLNMLYKQALTAELEDETGEAGTEEAEEQQQKKATKPVPGLSVKTKKGRVIIDGVKDNQIKNNQGKSIGTFTAAYDKKTGTVKVDIKLDEPDAKKEKALKSAYEQSLTRYYDDQIGEVEDAVEPKGQGEQEEKVVSQIDTPWADTEQDTFVDPTQVSEQKTEEETKNSTSAVSKTTADWIKQAKAKARSGGNLRPVIEGEKINRVDDPEAVRQFFADTLAGIDFKNVPHAIKSGNIYGWGRYINHYVEVATGAPFGTGYHEAFHAVWDSYLTDVEQAEILQELKSRQGTFDLYGKTYDYATADYDTLMEAMAEEFRMYKEQHPDYTKPSKLTNFFKRLWNFLQHLVGKPTTLNEVFQKMNSSWYKDAKFVREPESKERLSEMTNVTKPELKYIMENTSERIIDALRKSNGGLISVAQGNIIADLIRPGFEWMKDYYENRDEASKSYPDSIWGRAEAQIANIMKSKEYTDKQKEMLVENIASEIDGAVSLWEKMKNKEGDDFSNELKKDLEKYLRRYKLRFINSKSAIAKKRLEMRKKQDQAEIAEGELFEYEMGEENRDRSYERKELQIDLSRNAPDEIKLLFSFLTKPESYLDNPNKNADSGDALVEPSSKLSPLLLPELLQGSKWMYMSVDRLAGITNPAIMKQAMWQLAKENPELVKVYNSVYKEAKTREDFMMRISFKKFMSKVKPLYTRWIKNEGQSTSFIAESEGASSLMLSQWESSLRGASIVDANGRYAVNTSKLTKPVQAKRGTEASEERSIMQFLSDIRFPVKPDLFRRLGNDRAKFVTAVLDFYSELKSDKKEAIRFISVGEFDSGALREMAKIITKVDPENVVTQHNRPDSNSIQNHIQFNGITREINKIIEAGSLAELEKSQPLLFTDTWCSSLHKTWLRKGGPLFDENGVIRKDVKDGKVFKFAVMEGLANPDDDFNPSTVTTEMTEPIRFMHNLIHNISGISGMVTDTGIFNNFIPGDSSLEGSLVMSHSITWKDFQDNNRGARTLFKNRVMDFLKDEINLIKENVAGVREKTKASTAKAKDKRENGKRLQIFKTLLPEELVKRIEDYANNEGKDAALDTDAFLSDKALNKEITDAVMAKMDDWSESQFKKLKEAGLLKYHAKKDEYSFLMIDKKFLDGKKFLSKDGITDILLFRNMNLFMHNTLMRKMFHGPWYEVLDPEKRDKGDYTCTEFTYAGDEEFNTFMNTREQQVQGVKLTQGDPGYHNYTDELKFLVFDNDKGVVSKYINKLRKELGSNAGPHEKIEDGNAQSLMYFKNWKEYVIRSGDKWTEDHELQHQYDIASHTLADAKRRNLKLRPELKKACEDIVNKGNPHFEIGTPRKPLGAGFMKKIGDEAVTERMKFFVKTSTFRLSYDIAKERGLEDLYWFMNDNNIGLTGPQSMLKVGNLVGVPELYRINDKGKAEFALNRADNANGKSMTVSWTDFSKILETEHEGMGATKASQLNSIAISGSMHNGLPLDFFNVTKDNFEEKYKEWMNMPGGEAAREKASPLYKLVKENTNSIKGLLNHGVNMASKELGVKKVNGEYSFTNPEKIVEFIRNKAVMGDLTDNIAEAIDWVENPNTGKPQLKYDIESVPGFQSVRKVLWSVVDRSIVRMKMNGDSYINVSSVLWEKQGREGMIKKGDEWVTVTPEMYKKMSAEERRKIVPTSSELATYKRGDTLSDGSIAQTDGCEVYLPNYLLQQMMSWAEATGKSIPDEYSLYKHLNSHEGGKLLTCLGFRIPIQGMNSIESMRVKPFNEAIGADGKVDRKNFKLFLPGEMGSSIVLPSEVVSKSGTDFDVDKTSTYHYNFYINKKGYPIYIKFYDGEDLQDDSILKEIYEQRYSKKERNTASSSVLMESLFGEKAMDTDSAPTLEQFIADAKNDPDPYRINSFEAIQNKYFDTLHGLVLHPHNYKQLMLPNSSEELKSIGKHLNELEGQDITKDKNEVDYSRLLDPSHMSESRQRYLDAKGKTIGIGAQNNTYHALAATQFIPINKYLGEENVKIWLPHYQVEMNGTPITTISSAFNKKGNWISDVISQVINGGVDAVKDDFLIDLVRNKDLVAPALFLGRVGVDPEYVFTFLRQPIVQEFMKEITNYRALGGIVNSVKLTKENLRQQIKKNLMNKTRVDPKLDSGSDVIKEQFRMEDLEEMITATAKAKGDISALTPKQRKLQRQVLNEFVHYLEMSDNMLSEQIAIKWDNIRGFTDSELLSKNLSYENAKEANVVGTVSPIIDNTFQGAYKDALNDGMGMLSTIMTVSSSPELRGIFEQIAGSRMKAEKKQQLTLTALYSFIDYAAHTKSKLNGKKLNEYIHEVMLGKNNAADLWSKFRRIAKGDIDDSMKDILNNLRSVRKYSSKDVKNITLTKKPSSSIEKDVFTFALEDIKNNPHNMMTALDAKTPEEQKSRKVNLYQRLVLNGLLQTGVRTSGRNAWTDMIPNNDYLRIIKQGVDAIKSGSVNNFNELGALYRGNWRDDDLVPRGRKVEDKRTGDKDYPYKTLKSQSGELESTAKENKLKVPKFLEYSANSREARNRFMKTVEYTSNGPIVRLYERVETADNKPWVSKKQIESKTQFRTTLFKQVNAWGDGRDVREYYDEAQASVLPFHEKVYELNNDQVINLAENKGFIEADSNYRIDEADMDEGLLVRDEKKVTSEEARQYAKKREEEAARRAEEKRPKPKELDVSSLNKFGKLKQEKNKGKNKCKG